MRTILVPTTLPDEGYAVDDCSFLLFRSLSDQLDTQAFAKADLPRVRFVFQQFFQLLDWPCLSLESEQPALSGLAPRFVVLIVLPCIQDIRCIP